MQTPTVSDQSETSTLLELELRLGQPCFFDASCAANVLGSGLNEIKAIVSNGVKRSKALVLLQIKSALTRPSVLLEVYTAFKLGIPVVTVTIEGEDHPGSGYDHELSKDFLGSLHEMLEVANPGSVAVMKEFLNGFGDTFENLENRLYLTIPNVISISWTPDGSVNHWTAVVEDIVDKVSLQQEAKLRDAQALQEEFLAV